MWTDKDNNIIKTPRDITVDGVTYPKIIFTRWSKAELAELGITPYEMPAQKNQRYYWNNTTPRDVDQLKENMIATVKEQVGARISPTDWMHSREQDGDGAMPADVKAYRKAVRAEGNQKENDIKALSTIDAIIEYENRRFVEVRKVKHTDANDIESYGPETVDSIREIDMTKHFSAVDPLAEVDPAFVSLNEV